MFSLVSSTVMILIVAGWAWLHVVDAVLLVQDGTTPLYDACSRGDTAIVKVLVAVPEVNPNIPRRVSPLYQSLRNLVSRCMA
jgi:hypothetical protein